jgi:hypothetical protein
MNVDTNYNWLIPYRSADGKTVTASLYTDRTRQPVQGCTQIGVDCFPIRYEAVPVGAFSKTADTTGATPGIREYDVSSPVTGKSLIRFPN